MAIRSKTGDILMSYTPTTVGDIVLVDLANQGMTQSELAERSGISPTTLNNIIKGKRKATTKQSVAIARNLNLRDDFLLDIQKQYELYLLKQKQQQTDVSATATIREEYDMSVRIKMSAFVNEIQTVYRFSLDVLVYEKDGQQHAVCPCLGIKSVAHNLNTAISNIYRKFQNYVERCVEKGILLQDLALRGWKVSEREITPPALSACTSSSEYSKIIDTLAFQKLCLPAQMTIKPE